MQAEAAQRARQEVERLEQQRQKAQADAARWEVLLAAAMAGVCVSFKCPELQRTEVAAGCSVLESVQSARQ